MLWAFGGRAAGEYLSGYLIEESLSIDNVFVWALILAYFLVPPMYQHRVLFWGIFGAMLLRATFIFAGIALIQRFDFVLVLFGLFLLYTAWKLHDVARAGGRPVEESSAQGRAPSGAVDGRATTARSCSRTSMGAAWPRRCSRCCCWSRRRTSCSRSTPYRRSSP